MKAFGIYWSTFITIIISFSVDILRILCMEFEIRMCKTNGLNYSTSELVNLNSWNHKANTDVWTKIKDLGINVQYRGTRGGSNIQRAVKTIITRSSKQVGQKCNRINWSNLINTETKQYQYKSSSKIDQSCLLKIGLLNCQSVRNQCDIIVNYLLEKDLDILILTQTWLRPGSVDTRIIIDLVPSGYTFKHRPRSNGLRGGGIGILFKSTMKFKEKPPSMTASFFESMECYFSIPGSCIHTALIYRVPPSKKNKISKPLFLDEFSTLLEKSSILPGKLLIPGDFNLH